LRIVIDTETNSLTRPTEIWIIVCKDIDTGKYYYFRNTTNDVEEREAFFRFSEGVQFWIGHNLLDYDHPVINRLLGSWCPGIASSSIDTLIVSRLVEYSRSGGHSIEEYGLEYNFPKIKIDYKTFTQWTQEMQDYCQRDVDICHMIYLEHLKYITDCPEAVRLEHEFQTIVNALHDRGFGFNTKKAEKLLSKVQEELNGLDAQIALSFPTKLYPIREIHPRITVHGTLHKGDFRWVEGGDLSEYNGGPFTRCDWRQFNPASHRQVISVLSAAGWSPHDKTDTHVETERELNRLKYSKNKDKELDLTNLRAKLLMLEKHGWKINENNLSTLPPTAPAPARTLARRILFESRRRTLTEWLGLVNPGTDRIHGSFVGIGAWTHRMAHRNPNTANIPNAVKISDGSTTLLGKELRSLWQAPKGRLLVGVDAEAIQLRIFAHLIDDPELTNAIVNGKKSDKTDPHSLNQRYFGVFCKTRNAAKHSLYAIFFGGGPNKIAHIMACKREEAIEATENLKLKYPGLQRLEKEVFPNDAKRGYFIGLDGRRVLIPSDTISNRKHLCMSGYLQNGEAVVMKKASVKFFPNLPPECFCVDLVHDEWQTEVPNNMEIALQVAKMECDALKEVGEELKLKCPLAGSFYNDDHKDYTIGTTWYQTH
jgi:DNA polymerase I